MSEEQLRMGEQQLAIRDGQLPIRDGRSPVRNRQLRRAQLAGVVLTLAVVAAGCAAGKAFQQGETAMKAGQLDEAVAAYRKALQASPDDTNYKIALQRAMQAASRAHLEKAREVEQRGELEVALGGYPQASDYHPRNPTP